MVSIGFLLALVAAYWVYTDARGRGYQFSSALLWAVGTLAALFIFLPLYLLFGRKPQVKERNSEETIIDVEATVLEETIHCPMCGRKVKEEFKVCPYCGYTLRPKCQSCGQELNREWKTCPYCQTPAPPK